MSDRIKIGENEYVLPLDFNWDRHSLRRGTTERVISKWALLDADSKKVEEDDILTALKELVALREDFGILEARLKRSLDNARCPDCGCGDVEEAESNECGCDGHVCSVEVPEFLGEAYKRVCDELAALREEVAELRLVTIQKEG